MSRIGIVGAGLAGLTCARALTHHGLDVELFDKGRRPGGRVATRRVGGHAFDHGAQYFSVRDERFAPVAEAWRAAGVVARWEARMVTLDAGSARTRDAGRPVFVGVPTMSAIGVHLAAGLCVRSSCRVDTVRRDGAQWLCRTGDGVDHGPYDRLIIALPCLQARALLVDEPAITEGLDQVRIAPCWAVMLAFDAPPTTVFDAGFVDAGPLAWVAHDGSKPNRAPADTWVLHATPEWSQRHLEDAPDDVRDALAEAFWDLLPDGRRGIIASDVHRWRHARPTAPLPDRCRYDPRRRIGMCGDWCGGAKIESAVLSGLALAEVIVRDGA